MKFSELHAIDLVDMDGDGLKDIVTGKRFWSHGRTGDPDRNSPGVLYWFKLARTGNGSVDFIPIRSTSRWLASGGSTRNEMRRLASSSPLRKARSSTCIRKIGDAGDATVIDRRGFDRRSAGRDRAVAARRALRARAEAQPSRPVSGVANRRMEAGHSAVAARRAPARRVTGDHRRRQDPVGRAVRCEGCGTGAAVRRDTVFAACSNTKPVFAYAVVKLCEKGVMDLDVPLTKSATSRRFVEGDPRLDLITARHVLTHTTGFPNWREPGKPVPIQFTPGTRRQYSGEGFRYLQSVVQELTRQPFAEFMRVNVLEPFRMTSSRIVWDGKAYARRLARRHDKDGTPIVEPPRPETAAEKAEGLATYGAAAALHTTPADYAKFLIEIVDPKPADPFRLNERSRRDYLHPQFKRDGITSSGLGWVIGQHGALTFFNHSGSASGWFCESYASVGRKAGIVIMTNGDNFLPFREQLKLDRDLFTQLFAV